VFDSAALAGESAGVSGGPNVPHFVEWANWLDRGSMDELAKGIEETMRTFQEESSSRESLDLFYFGFVHLLLQGANRKGASLYETITMQELVEGQSARTPANMQAWAVKLLKKVEQSMGDRNRDSSAIISKIQSFIHDNLHQELSRDDIAGSVYRNPAYLSRLFRKETGLSLTDYIVQAKIEKAKRLLMETNDKISNIAEGLGYVHFSYFAKLFKKVAGLTPQEYRKKHQMMP
jgi:two-component system response regulator YesN